MHDTDDIGSNASGNPHLQDMIDVRVQRRSFLSGSVAVAATGFFGGSALASTQLRTVTTPGLPPLLGFNEVAPSTADAIVVPAGYTSQVLAPWGTPLLPGAASFRESTARRRRRIRRR
jgi:secreted PhoX family phosphatase